MGKLFTSLGKKMAAAGKAGTYSSWMFEESDLIQHAAKSFGDRLVADRMALAVAEADQDLKPILTLINTLYLATIIEKNLGWFGISDTMLSAPIALDWVGYNTYDNQGELMSEQE